MFRTTTAVAIPLTVVAKGGDLVSDGSSSLPIYRVIGSSGAITSPIIADSGHVIFEAQLSSINGPRTLVRYAPNGQLQLIAKSGTNAAGGTVAPVFATFETFGISTDGMPAFSSLFQHVGTDVTTANDLAWWTGMSGANRQIAREGFSLSGGMGLNRWWKR